MTDAAQIDWPSASSAAHHPIGIQTAKIAESTRPSVANPDALVQRRSPPLVTDRDLTFFLEPSLAGATFLAKSSTKLPGG